MKPKYKVDIHEYRVNQKDTEPVKRPYKKKDADGFLSIVWYCHFISLLIRQVSI